MSDRRPARLKNLRLVELSLVDNPANQHARVTLVKRNEPRYRPRADVLKVVAPLTEHLVKRYMDPADGALTFADVLENNKTNSDYNNAVGCWREPAARRAINTFDTVAASIIGDSKLAPSDKTTRLRETVESFLIEINSNWPEIEEALHGELKYKADLEALATAEKNADALLEKINKTSSKTGEVSPATLLKEIQDKWTDVRAALVKASPPLSKESIMSDAEKKAAELEKKIAELSAVVEKSAEAETALKNAQAEIDKLKAELETAKAKADMSEEERAFLDEEKDEEKRKKFMSMKSEERKALITEKSAGDETIVVEGTTLRKSVVGEATFAVFKAQADKIAKQAEDFAKERDLRISTELTKRAESEYDSLPGTVLEKVAVLKSIESLPEATQKTLNEMLTAGQKALKAGFSTIGAKGGKGAEDKTLAKAQSEWLAKVSEIAKRDELPRAEAVSVARKEAPELFSQAYPQPGSTAN